MYSIEAHAAGNVSELLFCHVDAVRHGGGGERLLGRQAVKTSRRTHGPARHLTPPAIATARDGAARGSQAPTEGLEPGDCIVGAVAHAGCPAAALEVLEPAELE